MTDLADLPPLPPMALSSDSQAGPTLVLSGHGEDLAAGRTDLADLSPLQPLALSRTTLASPTKPSLTLAGPTQAGPALFPSGPVEDLVAGVTVLMAGLVALAWAFRLDASEGQVLVAASTSFTLLAPAATCVLLRSASRRARLQ
jgi:hypothetical protein